MCKKCARRACSLFSCVGTGVQKSHSRTYVPQRNAHRVSRVLGERSVSHAEGRHDDSKKKRSQRARVFQRCRWVVVIVLNSRALFGQWTATSPTCPAPYRLRATHTRTVPASRAHVSNPTPLPDLALRVPSHRTSGPDGRHLAKRWGLRCGWAK